MYRPLPKSLTIRHSEVDGLGLFTTEKIAVDTILGIAHIHNLNFPHGYIRTGMGAFYNHSDKPNCVLLEGWHQHLSVKYLVTLREIKAKEEILCTYTLYDEFE